MGEAAYQDAAMVFPSTHHFFLHRLDEEVKRSQRSQRKLAVVMVEVSGAEEAQRRFGAERAEGVLKMVYGILKRCIRDIDLLARFEHSRFKVLLPETGPAGAEIITDRIRREVEAALRATSGPGDLFACKLETVIFGGQDEHYDQGLRPAPRQGQPRPQAAAFPSGISQEHRFGNLIGKCEAMTELYRLIARVGDTSHSVVIYGESGTGKELVANALHQVSGRRGQPFIAENCAALSESLLEAELFGFVEGAFTGATKNKKGLFELADGGTLFLDEVGDMSVGMQTKLLRVLQEGQVRPLGSKELRRVDVRIVAASNKDLRALVASGEFREDLFYRLNVITIKLPALRERREDVPLLVDYFLERISQHLGQEKCTVEKDVMALWMDYDWPGNVRELENEVKKAVTLADGYLITREEVSAHIRGTHANPARGAADEACFHESGMSLKEHVERIEQRLIVSTLERTDWNKSKTSDLLGLSWNGLSKKIKRYGIAMNKSA